MSNKPLMQRLLDAGYPQAQMCHHCTDLYVYVTPLTTAVIKQWCEDNGYAQDWNCPTFVDEVTGETMYECVFQYIGGEEDE